MLLPRPARLVLLVLVAPLLTAMGGGGGSAPDSIPRPKENYAADLLDRQGVVTRVSLMSCNGKTVFPLNRGEGMIAVPFAKITRVKLTGERGADVDANLQIDGGKTLDGRLPRTLLCTGSTEFGNYQVEMRGLKEILFVRP